MEKAILSSADRTWLFNPKLEKAEEELRAEAVQEAAHARAREKRQFQQNVDRLVAVLRQGVRKRVIQPDKKLEAKMAEVADAGLSEHVGIQTVDGGCFAVGSSIWQTAVMHQFVMREWITRHFSLREVRDFLRDSGFVLPEFCGRIEAELADAIRASEPTFLSPWEAAHRYLVILQFRDLVNYQGDGDWHRRPEVATNAQGKIGNAKAHRQRATDIKARLGNLLSRLKEGDSIDADVWMNTRHSGYSESPFDLAKQGYGEYSKFWGHLSRLESMLKPRAIVEENLLGLPMERELNARKEEHRQAEDEKERLAAERAQKDAEEVRIAALRRKTDLVYEAISTLRSEEAKNWISQPLACLGGEPLNNRVGLTVTELSFARSELRRESARQLRESQRREFTEALSNEAVAYCGTESGEQWMRLNNSFLANRKPLEVCVDALGLEECRKALKQFTRRGRRR